MTKQTLTKCKCPLSIMNEKKSGKKKSQRVESENLKITQALSRQMDTPTAYPIYLQGISSHTESETSGEEFSSCSSKRIHASNQNVGYPVHFSRKIMQSKILPQVADREALLTNHYFAVVASTKASFMDFFNDFKIFRSCFKCSHLLFIRILDFSQIADFSYCFNRSLCSIICCCNLIFENVKKVTQNIIIGR